MEDSATVRISKDGTPVGRISFQIEVVSNARGAYNPTTAALKISAQQPSRWVGGRRNTFVGLVLQSSLKNRKANVVLALSEIPGFQLCRPARGRKRSSSPSQFLSPSLRLRSLERFVRQSRKHIRI